MTNHSQAQAPTVPASRITVRRSADRGAFDFGWLKTRHSFSFGEYYDPRHMGFRKLRVLNEDRVAPGEGFPTHPHRDMEIVTYVLAGALEHEDSMGHGSVIRPGDVQRMSAGSGITHSEYNHSDQEPVHFVQIWILPERTSQKPSYEQKQFSEADRRAQLRLIASRDGRDGSVTVHQDLALHAAILAPGEAVTHALVERRAAYLQVLRGRLDLNGLTLEAGDAAQIESGGTLTLSAGQTQAELLLFDLG